MTAPAIHSPAFLVVLDADSTMLREEVIELIADEAGVLPAVAAVTEQAMRGELDFASSLRERVGLLAGLPVASLERVRKQVHLTAGVPELIAAVQAAAGRVCVVSGGFHEVLDPIAQALGLDAWKANHLGLRGDTLDRNTLDGEALDGATLDGGALDGGTFGGATLGGDTLSGLVEGPIIDGEAKAAAVREWIREYRIPPSRTVVVGDGANDLLMMKEAALSVAFNAKPRVREAADLCICGSSLAPVLSLLGLQS